MLYIPRLTRKNIDYIIFKIRNRVDKTVSNICQNQGVDACIFKMICEIFVKYFYLLNQCVFIIAVLYTVLQKKIIYLYDLISMLYFY